MNISVTLPNVFPNTLAPPTEAARRDNLQREVIAQPKEAQPYAKEPEVGAEKDRTKPRHLPQYPQQDSVQHERINERDQQAKQQQGQGEGEQQGQSQQEQGQQGQSQNQQEKSANGQQLSESEKKKVEELKARDAEVRLHEQQHAAAGGQYASAPSYSYENGPDGKRYAVDGQVSIDVSPVAGDPQATIDKMRQVERAALAPAQPSPEDRSVAATAQANIREAQQEIAQSRRPPGLMPSEEQASVLVTNTGELPEVDAERFERAELSAAEALRQRFPDIAQQMEQRNQSISSRYQNAYAAKPNAQFSVTA